MKTIKNLVELNDAHTIQLCATTDYIPTHIMSIYSVISSFKHCIKIIGDTEICIYTNKNVDIQQVMDMPVDIDRRYNLLVLQDV